MRALVVAVLLAVGCGAARDGGPANPDANPSSDSPIGCQLSITLDPATAVADPVAPIRATATALNAPGVLTYTWTVTLGSTTDVPFTYAQLDHSQIEFIAATEGLYYVQVSVDNFSGCFPQQTSITVSPPDPQLVDYRLRVVPDPAAAPPQEQIVQVLGGADIMRTLTLDPGAAENLTVTDGTTGVPAYVRFIPAGMPNAFVEAFSNGGLVQARTLLLDHQVLIVPAVPGLAPERIAWTPDPGGGGIFTLSPGTTVHGTVTDPGGVGLAGAKVQLTTADGLPSTLATTDASGRFTIQASFPANAMMTAEVTPPPGRGLPVLSANGLFDLGATMQIRYASTLATCDLAATPVKRSNIAQPDAKVTVVGALVGAVGTVVTGSASANGRGSVRISATADATGKLPSLLVPRAALHAIVDLGGGDLALSAIDTSTCAAQTISAPAMATASGVVQSQSAMPLRSVAIEASPAGALAGMPPVQTMTAADGTFSLALVSGGVYDVRFVDPSGIGAPLALLGVTSGAVPATAVLPAAIHIKSDVGVSGNPNPVVGASVQVLCATCTGIDAARPLAQGATDSTGQVVLAIPDPGTM